MIQWHLEATPILFLWCMKASNSVNWFFSMKKRLQVFFFMVIFGPYINAYFSFGEKAAKGLQLIVSILPFLKLKSEFLHSFLRTSSNILLGVMEISSLDMGLWQNNKWIMVDEWLIRHQALMMMFMAHSLWSMPLEKERSN